MNSELSLPFDFGSFWDDFIRDWCLGAELGYTQSDVIRALNALERLWPDHVSSLATQTARGVGVVAAAVELGCLLANCEGAPRFTSVSERVRRGERSAYSELVVVSSLSRLGYYPSFDEPLEGKNLDAKCDVDGQSVYFEVIAPERFYRGIKSQRITEKLRDDIMKIAPDCRIEVELFDVPTEVELQAIVAASRDAEPGEWTVVEPVARIRTILSGHALPPV